MSSKIVHPHTVEGIFENFSARRSAIIRALTTDVDDFYGICDPKKENLCLFGHPNETWEVSLPSEEVPAELPEPALGINFARDGMNKKDWLSLVAIHSDCWLLSVAFYYAAGLNGGRRKQLFTQINKLPTVFEVIKQTNSKEKKPGVNIGKAKDGSSDNYEGNEAWCGCCRGTYSPAEFWICCDSCDTWFHGNCVKITQVEADSMSTYNCASCLEKGGQ